MGGISGTMGAMGSAGSGDGERAVGRTAGIARIMNSRTGLKVRSSYLLRALIYPSNAPLSEILSQNADIGPNGPMFAKWQRSR
jgi:hypothetical protein